MRRTALYSALIALFAVGVATWAPSQRVEAAVAVRPVPTSPARPPAAEVAVVSAAKPKPPAAPVVTRSKPVAAQTVAAVVRPARTVPAVATPRTVLAHPAAPVTHQAPLTHQAPVPPATPAPTGGCVAALAYLAAHAAPGFTFACPGNALGHQAMTCINEPGVCPDQKLIAIAVPCPASWMNEASNSWVLSGLASRPIDPYGYCH
jgi:hypothetical protein